MDSEEDYEAALQEFRNSLNGTNVDLSNILSTGITDNLGQTTISNIPEGMTIEELA
jgi:hypothetical protein